MLRCSSVRTTIRLDEDLYRQVKVKAARSGRTVAALIEDAVRVSLAPVPAASGGSLPPLPVYGIGGVMPGVDLSDNAGVLDVMEEGQMPGASR